MMVATFLFFIARTTYDLQVVTSALLAIVVTAALGLVCFKLFFDRIKEHPTTVMIIAVALAMLFQEILLMIFAGTHRGVQSYIDGYITIFDTRVTNDRVLAIGFSAFVLVGLWFLLNKTRLGNAIRVVADDREIANLMGINVSYIYMVVMVISVSLTAIAGVVMAPILMINPVMWLPPLIVVLAAVVLGGLGSLGGSVIGAFILGFAETVVAFVVPGGSFLRNAVALAVMLVVLMVRPEGLFGVRFEEERL
jgi:branched-chain amino acid transport system permease protein